MDGEPIGGYTDGYMSFNIWVSGTQSDHDSVSAKTTNTADLVCISGTGANWFTDEDFDGIREVMCEYGYVSTHSFIQAFWISFLSTHNYLTVSLNRLGMCARK